jgi:hypothetical protein
MVFLVTLRGGEVKIQDPDSGSGYGFGIRIRVEHPGSYFREFRNNFLGPDADPDPGSGIFVTLDPPGSGMENLNPRSGIGDKQPGSATLHPT